MIPDLLFILFFILFGFFYTKCWEWLCTWGIDDPRRKYAGIGVIVGTVVIPVWIGVELLCQR